MSPMKLEQGAGSVITYLFDAAQEALGKETLASYIYNGVPAGFQRPSVYFPVPELDYEPLTLDAYTRLCILYVLFFGRTLDEAHMLASAAQMKVHRARSKIPLLNEKGEATDRFVRTKNVSVRVIDSGAHIVQLALTWMEHYRFDDDPVDTLAGVQINLRPKHF